MRSPYPTHACSEVCRCTRRAHLAAQKLSHACLRPAQPLEAAHQPKNPHLTRPPTNRARTRPKAHVRARRALFAAALARLSDSFRHALHQHSLPRHQTVRWPCPSRDLACGPPTPRAPWHPNPGVRECPMPTQLVECTPRCCSGLCWAPGRWPEPVHTPCGSRGAVRRVHGFARRGARHGLRMRVGCESLMYCGVCQFSWQVRVCGDTIFIS